MAMPDPDKVSSRNQIEEANAETKMFFEALFIR
jgi:hypothetical protein